MTAGAIVNRLATLDIESTILNRGELGPNISNDSGTVTSHGYNLSSDDGGGVLNGPGDQINTESAGRSVTKQWRSDLHTSVVAGQPGH